MVHKTYLRTTKFQKFYAVKDIDEAVSLANDTEFGLGGTVTDKAVEVARRIDTGMVYINHVTGIAPESPFGRTKNQDTDVNNPLNTA